MRTRAEISCGAIFLPCTSTQASPLSAFAILYGTILMSRCTTSSSNLRPMRRLMANNVFWGFVTACRLAGWPTSTSLSLVNATIEGVVRSPSLFSITRGLPPSMMATHELVVPRSMPITFAIGCYSAKSRSFVYYCRLFLKGYALGALFGEPAERIQGRCNATLIKSLVQSWRLGDDDPGRPQQPPIDLIARLHHLQNRVRLRRSRRLGQHGLVAGRIEGLPHRVDGHDPDLFQGLGKELERGLLSLLEAADVGFLGTLHGELEAVPDGQQLSREFLQAVAVRCLDVLRSTLADVIEIRDRAEVLRPVILSPLLGLAKSQLQTLELDQLRRRLRQYRGLLACMPVAPGLVRTHSKTSD